MRKILYTLVFILVVSCSNDDVVNYDVKNETEISNYITENDLSMTKTVSGLYYAITTEGTGDTKPSASANVTLYYKGYFTDGTVFDESTTGGATLNLNQLISGFSEGVRLLTEGGAATLIIPSKLAYGDKEVNTIPAGSVLIFDIKLISIN